MECFVKIVSGWKPLTIIAKHSILNIAEAQDPPMEWDLSDKIQLSESTYNSHTPRIPPVVALQVLI